MTVCIAIMAWGYVFGAVGVYAGLVAEGEIPGKWGFAVVALWPVAVPWLVLLVMAEALRVFDHMEQDE